MVRGADLRARQKTLCRVSAHRPFGIRRANAAPAPVLPNTTLTRGHGVILFDEVNRSLAFGGLVSLLPSLLFAVQVISGPGYWDGLTPGTHTVGFSQRWVIDSTRRLPYGQQYGLTYRPVLLNVWYPTTAAAGTRMPYDDYFAGALRVARGSPAAAYASALVDVERRIAWRELAKTPRDSTPPELRQRIESLFAARSLAIRDAPFPEGAFPVVVYTQGAQSSMDDNVVLCEYLASRGYIVIGSAFPGEADADMFTNSTDESRPRDIRRLVLEVSRMRKLTITSVSIVGHSAGAQAMLAFSTDPSAPVDAVLSLDTTEDYSMLSDRAWASFTDRVVTYRKTIRMPLVFVAGPTALFELADSVSGTSRWLVTVPGLSHNDFISQGNIRKQLLADLPGGNAGARDTARRSYQALVEYLTGWLDARQHNASGPPAREPLHVTVLQPGEQRPQLDGGIPRTARETRHLFATVEPAAFAELAVRARAVNDDVANNDVLMMLLVDAIRRGEAPRARLTYEQLTSRDSTVRDIGGRIRDRASLFDRVGATSEADGWRAMLRALGLPDK